MLQCSLGGRQLQLWIRREKDLEFRETDSAIGFSARKRSKMAIHLYVSDTGTKIEAF